MSLSQILGCAFAALFVVVYGGGFIAEYRAARRGEGSLSDEDE